MKTIVLVLSIVAATLSACSNNSSSEADNSKDTATTTAQTSSAAAPSASVDEAVTAYLRLKNAFTNDESKEAAEAAKQLENSILKLDNASFDAEQKKVYDDVQEDIKEHIKHISTKAGDIAHQREHFEILSKDMYDLVKAVKPSQTLYQTHCPMFNNKKGANWLSETKEIKNPYYGKEMLTCGTVKEEIN